MPPVKLKVLRIPYIVKKVERLIDKTSVAFILAGAFTEKLDTGFARDIEDKQALWKPLNPEYKKRKIKQGYSGEAWVRTGATRKALTGGVITKVGTNKGVSFDVTSGGKGYLYPKTLFKYAKGSNPYQVVNRLNNGKRVGRQLLVWRDRDIPGLERGVAARIVEQAQGLGFPAKVSRSRS